MPPAPHKRRTGGNQRVVVMIEADYDDYTKPAFKYRKKHVYKHLRNRGFKIKLLRGTKARRRSASEAAKKANVAFLTGSGHGYANSFTGYETAYIFEVGNYQRAESNPKIAHFLSCYTALQLGPDFVRNGCRAYFGYTEAWAWPEHDADAFFRCDSRIDLALADGEPAGRALELARKEFDRTIRELNQQKGDSYSAGMLEDLRDHLCGPSKNAGQYGDPAARL